MVQIKTVNVQGRSYASVSEAKKFADHYGIDPVEAIMLLAHNSIEEANKKAAEMAAANADD